MEEFWYENAEVYSNEKFEINELGTHPTLIDAFERYEKDWTKILDYGCGDGALIEKLKRRFDFSLFDTSAVMLEIATKKLGSLDPTVYRDANEIPTNTFDCVFLSMVLVCVDTEQEIDFIVRRILETKRPEGYVFVANPHPCFRDRSFSSYFTEYSIGRGFNYFNEGDRHKLLIRDKPMEFYDYNWSMSFVLNKFVKVGLQLVEMIEVKDNETNEYYNPSFSPSVVYIFK
jgi:SAM-dependent methyltransferase